MKKHQYKTALEWTGNKGHGTANYRSYDRNYTVHVDGKAHPIMGFSDPSFLGDASRYNPEELFLSSIASCHMLWYLHLCAINRITVTEYLDKATGVMSEDENGGGRFIAVTLNPQVKVKDAKMIAKATELHEEANTMCFIANSCNFKIGHVPKTTVH
ncbi:OsmC family protein [Maribacter chungangensis]|uniref:OsmC family protein n=1 Tax=Maribacter chungangensis TaxID=1069117 RepID=A0ABW3B170_9FLAO